MVQFLLCFAFTHQEGIGMEDCTAERGVRTWGFPSTGVQDSIRSLFLTSACPSVYYCFLETLVTQEFSAFMEAWLLCHRIEMSVRTCRTLPSCYFLHLNVFMVPWHIFPVSRAPRSSCLEPQCQRVCAVHLAACVYEKTVLFVCGSFQQLTGGRGCFKI